MDWLTDLIDWMNVDRGDLILAVVLGAATLYYVQRTSSSANRQATSAANSATSAAEGVVVAKEAAETAKDAARTAQDQAGAAWDQARHARDSAEAARRQLELDTQIFQEQAQPYVYADIRGDQKQAGLLVVVVENLGRAVATDVEIVFDPPLDSCDVQRMKGVARLPFAALAPGRKVIYPFAFGGRYLNSDKPLKYNVRISARGLHGPVELAYTINLEDLRATAAIADGRLIDVVKAIGNVSQSVSQLTMAVKANSKPATHAECGSTDEILADLADRSEPLAG